MPNVIRAQNALGLQFNNKALLQRALTHRSYINENPTHVLDDNERLEFLGDAILDFVTAEYLYHRFPEITEGRLTNLRSALVRTEQLAGFAAKIELGDHLYLGRGEEDSGGRKRPAILCDAFEALIGALYLDQGIDCTQAFIIRFIEPALQDVLATDAEKDAKSQLQELAQSTYQITPTYRTVKEEGPDHAKEFTVEALIGPKRYGLGTGLSKQTAAQAAAAEGLKILRNELAQKGSEH